MHKNHYSSILFFFLIIVFTIYIIFFNLQTSTKLNEKFKIWGIHMNDIENFTINETDRFSISNIQIEDILSTDNSKIIKIRRFSNVDRKTSESYVKDRFLELNSLFTSVSSPYFGVITQTIECPDEFKPKINEAITSDQNKVTYYILYANERFTYGICSKDLVKYKTLFTFIYCSDKKDLYQFEIFSLPDEPDGNLVKIISSFKCHL